MAAIGLGAKAVAAAIATRHVGATVGASVLRGGLTKVALVAAVSFAGGAGTHALYIHTVDERAKPTVAPPALEPARAATSAVVPLAPSEPAVPTVALSALPEDVPRPVAKGNSGTLLRRRDRALLEGAQAALSRGNDEEALAMVRKHAAEFPQSELAEEREAIRIRLLAKLGRCEEARASAAQFAKTFPDSLQRGALERVCREPPK
jgi:hypothetical protein